MLICFGAAEVTLLGSSLTGIEQAVQKYELKFVKAGDRSFPLRSMTHVAAVTVNLPALRFVQLGAGFSNLVEVVAGKDAGEGSLARAP
jgi:hypothetical protein